MDDGRPARVPVAGRVLYKNEAIEGATVVFSPEDHKYAASALTAADGSFRLTTVESGDGAVPGKFGVIICKAEIVNQESGDTRELLPKKYLSKSSSGLTADVVTEQDNYFTFELND